MQTGSIKRTVTLIAGLLVAFLIASALSDAIIVLTGLKGTPGLIVSFFLYVLIFLAVLQLLGRYAHIVFFGFDRE
jgi:hypothetical protein